jgi:hypothetical protein
MDLRHHTHSNRVVNTITRTVQVADYAAVITMRKG